MRLDRAGASCDMGVAQRKVPGDTADVTVVRESGVCAFGRWNEVQALKVNKLWS